MLRPAAACLEFVDLWEILRKSTVQAEAAVGEEQLPSDVWGAPELGPPTHLPPVEGAGCSGATSLLLEEVLGASGA